MICVPQLRFEIRCDYSSYNSITRSSCKTVFVIFSSQILEILQSGMPRTAYYGIVTFMYNSERFYVAPEKLNLSAYDFGLQPSSDYYNEKWDKMTRYLEFQETYCIPTK